MLSERSKGVCREKRTIGGFDRETSEGWKGSALNKWVGPEGNSATAMGFRNGRSTLSQEWSLHFWEPLGSGPLPEKSSKKKVKEKEETLGKKDMQGDRGGRKGRSGSGTSAAASPTLAGSPQNRKGDAEGTRKRRRVATSAMTRNQLADQRESGRKKLRGSA